MRKLRRLPKPRIRPKIENKVVSENIESIVVDNFEFEYQEFIKNLKQKKEKDETFTQEEYIQDIQSDRQ